MKKGNQDFESKSSKRLLSTGVLSLSLSTSVKESMFDHIDFLCDVAEFVIELEESNESVFLEVSDRQEKK